MNKNKISFLIPVYGVESYIERCARSLFDQTYDNLEFIFVDDCTPDNSISVLKKVMECYPHRKGTIQIVRHTRNRGLAAARNTALECASGDYVIHVDSDDWVEPNFAEKCICIVQKFNVDIVLCGVVHEYKNSRIVDTYSARIASSLNKNDYLKKVITQRINGTIWGKMIKRELYQKNGIKALEGVNYAEDYAVLPLLIYHAQSIAGIPEVLCHYDRTNESSFTHRFSIRDLKSQMAAYINIKKHLVDKRIFEKELGVELLQIYASARRKSILAGISLVDVQAIVGPLNYNHNYWSELSINHKLIILFDFLKLYVFTKMFVLLSERFGNRYRNLK